MLSSLPARSLAPGPPPPRTAFERTQLRDFSEWFVQRVEAVQPDYLIPVETKGARLLDVVLDYARNQLGTPITVPILYRPALAYLDREELSGSKVLVLDDAKRTGNGFKRHCRRLMRFGVTDISAAICFSFDPGEEVDESAGREAYIQVADRDRYMDYVCQMTELVIASGLPPEVDHHLLDLELPGRLSSIWGELEQALAAYGDLHLDAPEEQWGELHPMTLHFPDLPGTTAFPETGALRDDGPRKVRLFPDIARNRIVVVPVSFPTLDLDTEPDSQLSLEQARAQAREWSQVEGSLAEALLERATRRDPETVFRALSAFGEVDLASGLARVVAGAFPGAQITLRPQRELIERLYGGATGAVVADDIERSLARALAEPVRTLRTDLRVPLFVDDEVVETTGRIADHLRVLVDDRTRELGHEPPERVGRSLVGISSELQVKGLLTSRCLDFGLALTTVVPYVDVESRGDGVRVSRKYRVSEQGPRGRRDRQIDNQLIAEEILAYISMHLSRRSTRLAGRPLPLPVATAVLASLRWWLRSENVDLEIGSSAGGLRVQVWRGARRVSLATSASRMFAIEAGAVVPTPYFLDQKAAKELRLGKGGLTILLEAFLEALKPLFDADGVDEDDFERVLAAIAMSADQALGLSHVQELAELGLDKLEAQLNLIVRDRKHRDAEQLSAEVRSLTASARSCLEILESNWAARMGELWGEPSSTEEVLLESIAVPKEGIGPIYMVPAAVLDALDAAAVLSGNLDAVSAAHWEEEVEPGEAPGRVAIACADLCQALCSLKDPSPEREPPSDPREGIRAAAESLLDVVATVRSFSAAMAREDRGPRRGDPPPEPVEDDRFHTVLFPDLAKSTEYARDHTFDPNYEWRRTGLGILAQWGRAFGGVETRPRQGDAQWMEFERRGDPAVLAAAATYVHTEALAAAELPYLTWTPHLGVHFGRIKEAEVANAIGLTLDQMHALCKVGGDGAVGTGLNVTREVLDACSETLREAAVVASLTDVVQGEGADLTGAAADLHAVDPRAALEAFAHHLQQISATIVADFEAGGEGDARRTTFPVEAEIPDEAGAQPA